MDKAVGKTISRALIFALIIMPLGGCGTRKNVPSSSMDPAAKTGGIPGPVSGAAGTGSISVPSSPIYLIGPEDLLRISVWNNKDLTLNLTVRPDGKISVPLIQDIQAEGLTPPELADVIHQRLLAYIKDPHVSVIVMEVNSSKFFVVGAVNNPGTYALRGDLSILQALTMAGGFTPYASPKNIRLIRNRGGKQDVRLVNFFRVIENGSGQNYLIRPGDTVVVP
jgi:polysaccharide export outer membrane protein